MLKFSEMRVLYFVLAISEVIVPRVLYIMFVYGD